ncbi:MAG: hypothetical protein JNK79_05605 [Chitinophagaceae bacterium]|nr:hypothetical protein [Chitinophagaceae bacterium]
MLCSCSEKSGPDVSKISVTLETVRFEKDFFALDTNNIQHSLQELFNKNPAFFRDFTQHILGVPPIADSGEQAIKVFKQFIHDYRPVYDSVSKIFPDIKKYEAEIAEGLKHVRYYFPVYTLPKKLITFIGPMDAYFQASTGGYGDVITTDGLGIGLQLHLGKNFSMYTSEMGLALFPAYLSRKFSPEYIPVNCIKNIVDDMYPDESADKTLVEQMVEKGKRMYLLDKLMPQTHDTLKIGYTLKQLEGCRENEGLIWSYFVKNSLVYNNDPSLIKNYIGDSPGTPELGEGAPGYIGLFTGWQIVKKFMEEHEMLPLDKLMATDARLLFEQSKYRPK